MAKSKRLFLLSGALFLLFVLFTVLCMTVDRAPIAPDGSEIGFASLNAAVRDRLPYRSFAKTASDLLGYAALLVCVVNALYGLYLLIRNKSFLAVPPALYLLGGLYVLTIAAYVFFAAVPVNVRPILENGVAEPSFPSSHTLLAVVVYTTALYAIRDKLPKSLRLPARILFPVLAALTAVLRLLSGIHWFTDILAGLLLAAALLSLLYASDAYVSARAEKTETDSER